MKSKDDACTQVMQVNEIEMKSEEDACTQVMKLIKIESKWNREWKLMKMRMEVKTGSDAPAAALTGTNTTK